MRSSGQRQLTLIIAGGRPVAANSGGADLARFVPSLGNAWRAGEGWVMYQGQPKTPRHWGARKDLFEMITVRIELLSGGHDPAAPRMDLGLMTA